MPRQRRNRAVVGRGDAGNQRGDKVRDTVAAQKKFAEKYELNFPLLADTTSAICDAFGVIVEKNMYGKKSIGIQRSTFLIGADGKITKVWPRVSVEGHGAAVLEAVRSL